MSSRPLVGVAVGGPRDGARLEAPVSWDGRVRKPNHTGVQSKDFYPGYYRWEEVLDTYCWVWHWNQPPKNLKMSKTKM